LTAKLHAIAAVLKVLLTVEAIDAVGVETEVASELGELDNQWHVTVELRVAAEESACALLVLTQREENEWGNIPWFTAAHCGDGSWVMRKDGAAA
jgi:hypothetical protein